VERTAFGPLGPIRSLGAQSLEGGRPTDLGGASWVAASVTPDMLSGDPALQPPVLEPWWDGDGEGHPHSGIFETDRSATQSRRGASRGAQRGAWLASDYGVAASQSVMGDNLVSAPAGVAAPARCAPQPFYTTQQHPISGCSGANSKNQGADQYPHSYDSHPSMMSSLAELRRRRMEDDRRIQELEFRLQRLPAVHTLRQDCPADAVRPYNGTTATSGEQVDREVYFRQPLYPVRGDSCGVVADNRDRQRYSDSSCSRCDTDSSTVKEREMDTAPRRRSGRQRRHALR